MATVKKDKHPPASNPNVSAKIIIVPALPASLGPTKDGPSIIAEEAKYPLLKENPMINKIGKASFRNKMGSCELDILHNKIIGIKTIRSKANVNILFLFRKDLICSAVNLPQKSNKLYNTNKNGPNKSL
jgi:hypothetical protein